MMKKFEEYYNAIDEIKSCLIKDLFGPSAEEEVLVYTEPLSEYVTGILYPRKPSDKISEGFQISLFDADENELNADEIPEIESVTEIADDTIASANKYKPSSMGLSVMVSPDTEKITADFSCGIYKHSERTETKNINDEEKEIVLHEYKRIPHKISIDFFIPNEAKTITKEPDQLPNICIVLTVRKVLQDNSKLITISVINNQIETNKKHIRNESALFQCKLSLSSEKSFLPVYRNNAYESDTELQIKALLYDAVKNYGYGHGCAVSYDETNNEVFRIDSAFIPSEQVLQMMPGKIKNSKILYLNFWKNADRTAACKELYQFVEEYEEWKNIKKQEALSFSIYKKAANELIKRIEICIARLKNGIRFLIDSDNAWKAFTLMNEAMLLQRINTKHQLPENISWYPFQLAYILQIIPDMVNPKNPYRQIADLLWFPTGGGKTEAYLGVAAFTIFYRRLSENFSADDGVTVIMRYTLRLLTIQQFERAAALICACEFLRRKNNLPGGEISIGLWIGSGMTPNHTDDAKDVLERLNKNKDEKIYEGNPVLITKCPWCGQEIDITGYSVDNNGLHICCHDNPSCEFHKKLPIYVVDDDIYKQKPTLLLSTIDKFARIAWVEESKHLFGASTLPPSLIIQDELHLISGALGSLAGLYEIAVDYLCSKNGISPKVIASTATVKNADEQIKNLYNKDMLQFPPNGLSADDSFFAHIADKNERPARTYIGLCESGGSIADLMVRVYSLLTYIKTLFIKQKKNPDVIDQYYTIIGYFNAIKDLGASSNILQDRMYQNLLSLINIKFKEINKELELTAKDIPYFVNEELTSRKSAKEIKETLNNLDITYDKAGCYSYVLASNMLSVGIDINRLGLMTVYSQPKSNSEYIQATSRVGRQNPGLVISMYNAMRSRDKSHYEQFGFYHKSFYQYVESTSITPFSARAMEKALHCIFIAMVRLSVPGLGNNASAVLFKKDNVKIKEIKDFILKRIEKLHTKSYEDAEYLLNELEDAWERLAEIYPDLCYVDRKKEKVCLLNSAEEYSDIEFPSILNSLRNVEQSSNVYVKK